MTDPAPRGIYSALVTPLLPDGTLDEAGCRRLVEHVLGAGVHGVLALGSTGEVALLDAPTRRRVLQTVVEAVGGRGPVLAGVAQTSPRGAVDEARMAAAVGARAVVVVPPYYSPLDQASVLTFYRWVADGSPLPVLLYNIPGFTGVEIAPETVARLAEEGAVVGLKDSSRDFEYFQQVLDATSGVSTFRAFIGTDTLLLAALVAGGAGAITLPSSVAPAWSVRLYDLACAGRWAEAADVQRPLLRLVLALRAGVFPAAAKAALALLGVCGDTLAPPLAPLPSAEQAALAATLRELGVWPAPRVERAA